MRDGIPLTWRLGEARAVAAFIGSVLVVSAGLYSSARFVIGGSLLPKEVIGLLSTCAAFALCYMVTKRLAKCCAYEVTILKLICRLRNPPCTSDCDSEGLPLKVLLDYADSWDYVAHLLPNQSLFRHGLVPSSVDAAAPTIFPPFDEEKHIAKMLRSLGRLKRSDWTSMYGFLVHVDRSVLEFMPSDVKAQYPGKIYSLRDYALGDILGKTVAGVDKAYSPTEMEKVGSYRPSMEFLNVVLEYVLQADRKGEDFGSYRKRKQEQAARIDLARAIGKGRYLR